MIFLDKGSWEVRTTKNKGKGFFAKKTILKGVVIGDYTGTVLRTRDIDFSGIKNDLYLMYYHDQAVIDPDLTKPGIYLLNHSCNPNCWIYTLHGHTLFFALRNINAGEELTISYLFAPKSKLCNPCPHVCKCGEASCSKTFHLSEEKYSKWREFQETREKKDRRTRINYGSELKPLPQYPKRIPENYIKTVLLGFAKEA